MKQVISALVIFASLFSTIKAQTTTFGGVELNGNNSISSVNGFRNKIQFTNGNHGAIVFHPGQTDELMFGLHTNGRFYWGTGRSANQPNYYSMVLNGNNGNLITKGHITSLGLGFFNALSISDRNPISSVNGFSNRIEFTNGNHGAIVFHPGQTDELMFGLHGNGKFYWGTGRSASNPDYYSMWLDGNNGDLGIRGKLTANEIKVKAGGWADFVFKPNYNLPTLEQVEAHIKAKGHLQDIPSEAQVLENGIHVGEMNAKLLQKIEELTLYTIEQQKAIKALQAEVAQLKAKN